MQRPTIVRLLAAGVATLGALTPLGCSDGNLQAFSASVAAGSGGGSGGGRSSGGSSTGSSGGSTGSSGGSTAQEGGTSSASGGRGGSVGGASPLGGSPSVGGSGGTGGSATVASDLLDDFEDGDVRPIQGDGWWYTTGDPSKPSMDVAVSEGSLAFHAQDLDGGNYGFAGLDVPGWEYDASGFSKLRFRARVEPGTDNELRVKLLGTNAEVWAIVQLTTQWQEYVMPFSAFNPKEGTRDVLDPSSIAHIQFFFFMTEVDALDFWLDDVAFAK